MPLALVKLKGRYRLAEDIKLSASWEATQGDEEKIEYARKLACILIASKGGFLNSIL